MSLKLICICILCLTLTINAAPSKKQVADTLQECLNPVKGNKVFPNDAVYSQDIIDENTRITFKPAVIVYATSVEDVQTSVKCATTLKIGITARSGGHSYEKYGTGGRDGVLVVDLANLNNITINNSKKTAVIGAGNKLGPIYYTLSQSGFLIPAGSCPSVGVGGHSMGGGYGLYGRKFGLASDHISSVNMVNANGDLITASTDENPDLFFALRGAGGGSYGIVTDITFNLSPVPPTVTSFTLTYDPSKLQLTFDAMNQVGTSLPAEMTISLSISPNNVQIVGVHLGSSESAQSALKKFIKVSSPTDTQFNEETFFASVVRMGFQGFQGTINPTHHPNSFKAKSFFVKSPGLSSAGVQSINNFLNTIECSTFAEFDLFGGGAANSIAPDETAFVHRDTLYLIQLYTTLTGDESTDKICLDKLTSFGITFQKRFTSYFSYQNYIDRDLQDWQHRYYGSNFERLTKVKQKYDPKNLFNFPQSIPTSAN
ncbi:15066_t:CDS:2 [Acaulospora morrowiae]|uniref:15066_t:CDS:1 n=1 Tax=Acaulospora morrowiae TaxID=94023 RepID=A0A9N8ZUG8_9GLOM|nr:15066_t:CDS:2 [Acaulospora morrowiae]